MRSAVVGLPLRCGSAAAGFFRGRRRAIGFGFGGACFVGDRGAPTIVPAPPVRGVVNAELETLADFLASGRCDRHLCGEPPPKKRAPR